MLFDQSWLKSIRSNAPIDSWVHDVVDDIDNEGGVYLSVLHEWFLEYPFPSKGKKTHMKKLLESSKNHDHRGAVNEVCWYRLMRYMGLKPEVMPEGRDKSPDFLCTTASGIKFYCEVSTLNESCTDAESLRTIGSWPLNQGAEILRILRKATDEKAEQLQFGQRKHTAMAFVVFDYSTFSGLGTKRPFVLANVLLRTSVGLQAMKPHLSALIYVERYVFQGKCRIRTHQSALYHNPLADYQLPDDVFSCLRQHSLRSYGTIEPNSIDIVVS